MPKDRTLENTNLAHQVYNCSQRQPKNRRTQNPKRTGTKNCPRPGRTNQNKHNQHTKPAGASSISNKCPRSLRSTYPSIKTHKNTDLQNYCPELEYVTMSKYRGPLDPFLAETFLPISGFTATEYAQGFEKVPGQDQIPSLRALFAADMR